MALPGAAMAASAVRIGLEASVVVNDDGCGEMLLRLALLLADATFVKEEVESSQISPRRNSDDIVSAGELGQG